VEVFAVLVEVEAAVHSAVVHAKASHLAPLPGQLADEEVEPAESASGRAVPANIFAKESAAAVPAVADLLDLFGPGQSEQKPNPRSQQPKCHFPLRR